MSAELGQDGRVLAPFGRREVKLTAVDLVGGYHCLTCHDPAGPLPAPGQFYMLSAAQGWGGLGSERPFLPRALSVMRAEDHSLQFLLEAVGPGTECLTQLQVGDSLQLLGPLGNGYALPTAEDERLLLVGGGIGVAPLVALEDAVNADLKVLLGFRSAEYLPAAELFTSTPALVTDDGSSGRQGYVTDLLAEELEQAPAVVYACGPPAMLEAVRILALAKGSSVQLALEAPMACGYGACFGCVVETEDGYRRVCVDGPVFAGEELPDGALLIGGHQ